MSIRGLIFDFGGVIMDMRWDVARRLEREHGLERRGIFRTLYDSHEWSEIRLGRGDVEAWRQSAHRRLEEGAGRPLPALHQWWRESWGLIQENLDLIRSVKPTHRTAILSNADATLEERLRDGPGIYELFDAVIASAAVGLAKPDHRIYRLAADRLGLPADECVFVDDAEPNVTAAREVGMAAVHYRVDRGHNLAAQLADLGVRAGVVG